MCDQRKMRAGVDDNVDPVAARLVEKSVEDIAVGRVGLRSAVKFGLCKRDKRGRPVSDHRAIGGKAVG